MSPFRLYAAIAFKLVVVLMFFPVTSHATSVRMQTALGPIDIELFDTDAPQTVANFLGYVESGAYNNSFIHRSVPGFVIQGGGYIWDSASNSPLTITKKSPIINEFNPLHSNLRGTIAMAKVGGNPNSATSEWFINLADNSANLDTQNGGFTVFGRVSAASMATVDAIANLPRVNAGGAFSELPIASTPTDGIIQKSTLAVILTALKISGPSYHGLWWNPNESGWGMSLTHHGNIIFAALYTYDEMGAPVWYAIPNCPVSANVCTEDSSGTSCPAVPSYSCNGDIYKVSGGTPPTLPWKIEGKIMASVGKGNLTFKDANNGTFTFIDKKFSGDIMPNSPPPGAYIAKAITRQIFATGETAPLVNYTDLWWNPNESGWGVSLTQQFSIIFAAWFTYDATGNPIWYVATNCQLVKSACTGDLYQVQGGSPLTSAWNGANKTVTKVGEVTFEFTDPSNAVMTYTFNNMPNITTKKIITRQVF